MKRAHGRVSRVHAYKCTVDPRKLQSPGWDFKSAIYEGCNMRGVGHGSN